MTSQKHLKARVRARMSKTGERYASARRQIVPSASIATITAPAPQNPASAALRVIFSDAGIIAPHTGQPFTEAMIFGIGGGIGAGVFAFHYGKEDFSSFFVAGRHLWQDDAGWLKAAAARFGAAIEIRETTSARSADRDLHDLAAGGPVILWVDMGSLPYRGMPAHWRGMGQHLLIVRRIADGNAEIADLSDVPIELDLATLATARGRVKTQKHRIAALKAAARGRAIDLRGAVKAGLESCARGLVKQKMQNFTLDAFSTWAERLDGKKSKDSWEQMFPPGPNLWRALTSLYLFAEHWGGRSLGRAIFADYLAEAGAALPSPALVALSARYRSLARSWTALAETALPGDVAAAREAKQLYDRIHARHHERGAGGTAENTADWNRLEALAASATRFPMRAERIAALRTDLKRRVLEIHREEVAAREEMAAAAATL